MPRFRKSYAPRDCESTGPALYIDVLILRRIILRRRAAVGN